MMRFRLLRGTHSNGDRHPVTNKLITYRRGDVFDSPINLVAIHGREKFEAVGNDVAVTKVQSITPRSSEPLPQKDSGHTAKELEGMTLEELKRLAAEEEIDLGNLSKKNEIIARIVNSGSPVTA